jgi:hypothetical protein
MGAVQGNDSRRLARNVIGKKGLALREIPTILSPPYGKDFMA